MIVGRIQSHPSRRQTRERLIAGLDGLPLEVVETDFTPPSPWKGYKACLESLVDEDCTHALIVQDDAVACRNLVPALHRIAEAVPDLPVCLFLPMVQVTKRDALRAAQEGRCFVDIVPRGFLPVVAVLWPKEKAMHFLEWSKRAPELRRMNGQTVEHRSDDAMGYLWMRTQRQRAVATIPSLVQHPDDVPSTIAKRNTGRTALFWHGGDWDPLTVDWRL